MKIIFLDFDGVVTSEIETPGSYITNSGINYGPTSICVNRLLNLAENTGSKIVISSNWRKFDIDGKKSIWKHSVYGEIHNPLPKFIPMLKDFYLETLPPIRHIKKAFLAEKWLNEHNNIESFIALDDMCEYEGYCSLNIFKNRYINTNSKTGLTDEDCKKAFEILKIK